MNPAHTLKHRKKPSSTKKERQLERQRETLIATIDRFNREGRRSIEATEHYIRTFRGRHRFARVLLARREQALPRMMAKTEEDAPGDA